MKEVKSVLNSLLNDLKDLSDVSIIKQKFIECIQKSRIKPTDKLKMLNGIKNKSDYFKVTKYIYDCILKYEGDGVITKSLNGQTLR